ncbi:MAG TPA: DUF308 domain-containing protein [Candidatus Acutalibacter stercorigallinarum]|nr:DUF308 domain-containing protein [Candidatus Acutalibacter stercorigallinarum]
MRERTPWYRRVNWWELIAGIVMIALGVASLARPSLAVTGLVYAYGAAGVIVGVADILRYIRVERYTGFGPMVSLVAGVLSVMAGVVILVNPRVGMAVFSLLFALWFITHCISRLASLSWLRFVAGRGAYYAAVVLNLIGLVLGVLLVVLPTASLLALGYLAGVYLIVLGVESLVMAFVAL